MITLQTPRGTQFQVSRVQAERALKTQGVGGIPNSRNSPSNNRTQTQSSSPVNRNKTSLGTSGTLGGTFTSSSPSRSPMNNRSGNLNNTNNNSKNRLNNSIGRGSSVRRVEKEEVYDDEEDFQDYQQPSSPSPSNARNTSFKMESPSLNRTSEKAFSRAPTQRRSTSTIQERNSISSDVQQGIHEAKKLVNQPNATKGVDVWAVNEIKPDHTKVDSIQELLRTKIETLAGFSSDPAVVVRKVFRDVVRDGTALDEDSFVKMVSDKFNFQGYTLEIRALFRRFDCDKSGTVDIKEFLEVLLVKGSANFSTTIGRVREALAKRAGGVTSLQSLGLQFKIMDSSHDGSVNREEIEWGFAKFLRAYNIELSAKELDCLFTEFDVDQNGSISYEEFLHGIRGKMNEFRTSLVKKAFDVVDSDGSGTLTVQEIASRYDVSGHPQVKAGRMSPVEAIKNFMLQWQLHSKDKDDVITLDEFLDYYDWVSMSIDRDDYFELMIRNAWHISGGSGWSENTSNLRVLVTHQDGHQSIETVNDDLGIKQGDVEEIKRRLIKQGIKVKSISLKNASEN